MKNHYYTIRKVDDGEYDVICKKSGKAIDRLSEYIHPKGGSVWIRGSKISGFRAYDRPSYHIFDVFKERERDGWRGSSDDWIGAKHAAEMAADKVWKADQRAARKVKVSA